MTGEAPAPPPFELAAAELRALGIILARLPGEYRVNYRSGSDATARMAETLDEALELGRSMAADAVAPRGKHHKMLITQDRAPPPVPPSLLHRQESGPWAEDQTRKSCRRP
jgi:hypothetical protein